MTAIYQRCRPQYLMFAVETIAARVQQMQKLAFYQQQFHLLPYLVLMMQLCQDEVLEKWDNLLSHHFICNPITPSYRRGT